MTTRWCGKCKFKSTCTGLECINEKKENNDDYITDMIHYCNFDKWGFDD